MVGRAGIGYALLRLADGSVPSLLFSERTISQNTVAPDDRSYQLAKREYVRLYFGETLGHLPLHPTLDDSQSTTANSLALIRSARTSIGRTLARLNVTPGSSADASFRLDSASIDLLSDGFDLTADFVTELRRLPLDSRGVGRGHSTLSRRARLITLPQADGAQTYLIYRKGTTVLRRRLSDLASYVFECVERGMSLHAMVSASRSDLQGRSRRDVRVLTDFIRRQFHEAYRAGLIDVRVPPANAVRNDGGATDCPDSDGWAA